MPDAGREVIWEPSVERVAQSRIVDYLTWLRSTTGLTFKDYESLWRWSVNDLSAFWQSVWDYFEVQGERADRVLGGAPMPWTQWFPGARLNYAAHVFRHAREDQPALVAIAEDRPARTLTWAELQRQAASVAASLDDLGVKPGDRIVSCLPNIPEAISAFLGAASRGAVWSSCAPEFGAPSMLDRFRQIEPKVLFVSNGYRFGGKCIDRRAVIQQLRAGLPTVEHAIHVPYPEDDANGPLAGAISWDRIAGHAATWAPTLLAFDHPLWVLYSSGTTGLPKAIVHGHGGILLEHLKAHGLHLDLGLSDRFFWFTSTGWTMWNLLVSGLLMGATLVLYDGNPAYPTLDVLWTMAERARVTVFGGSASFFSGCMQGGLQPGSTHNLAELRAIGSTGAPLSDDAFRFLYRAVKSDVWVMSLSGGTDVATAFVGGNPMLPVRVGEIQCRWLGVNAAAFDEQGQPTDGVGELVIRDPMPSMPLYFWNDPQGRRYRESYFDMYPGVWRHGDWIEITEAGGAIIYGRSDSTINRRGVRFGTSELYRVLEGIPDVSDCLAVDLEGLGGASCLIMFVVLRSGRLLDKGLVERIAEQIRRDLSPRHVPDHFLAVPDIPRTLNGKKLEVPIKRILLGDAPAEVANVDGMQNPQSLTHFVGIADTVRSLAGLHKHADAPSARQT